MSLSSEACDWSHPCSPSMHLPFIGGNRSPLFTGQIHTGTDTLCILHPLYNLEHGPIKSQCRINVTDSWIKSEKRRPACPWPELSSGTSALTCMVIGKIHHPFPHIICISLLLDLTGWDREKPGVSLSDKSRWVVEYLWWKSLSFNHSSEDKMPMNW